MRYHVSTEVVHEGGNPAPGHVLTFYTDQTAATLATLYAEETGGATFDNPYTVGLTAIVEFWTEDPSLWVKPTGATTPSPLNIDIDSYTPLDDTEGDPAPIGTVADGTSFHFARRDHVHAGDHTDLTSIGVASHAAIDTNLYETSNFMVNHGGYNVKDYGATGDWSHDDTDAIQDALTAASSGNATVQVPSGTYRINTVLEVPANVSVIMDPAAVLKASAVMAAILRTPDNVLSSDQCISGGILDCNGLAEWGVHLRWFNGYDVQRVHVRNFQTGGVLLGSPTSGTGAGQRSSEARLHACTTWRSGSGPFKDVPAGSKGIYVANSSDHQIVQSIINGAETGVCIGGAGDTICGGVHLVGVHAWVSTGSANPMVTAFDDYCNGNFYTDCVADTPSTDGFRMHGALGAYANCTAYNNTAGTNNAADGFHLDTAYASLVGCSVIAQSTSHRFAKDVNAAGGMTHVDIVGLQTANIVTTIASGLHTWSVTLAPGPQILSGGGTPNGYIVALPGSIFLRTDTGGGAGTSIYVKESGTGNTGWVAK